MSEVIKVFNYCDKVFDVEIFSSTFQWEINAVNVINYETSKFCPNAFFPLEHIFVFADQKLTLTDSCEKHTLL